MILALPHTYLFGRLQGCLLVAVNILFCYFTAPIAAHMISRSAYINNVQPWQKTVVDEFDGNISQEGTTE